MPDLALGMVLILLLFGTCLTYAQQSTGPSQSPCCFWSTFCVYHSLIPMPFQSTFRVNPQIISMPSVSTFWVNSELTSFCFGPRFGLLGCVWRCGQPLCPSTAHTHHNPNLVPPPPPRHLERVTSCAPHVLVVPYQDIG